MAPKRKVSSAPQPSQQASPTPTTTVTVIPPVAATEPASKTPSLLKFPLLVLISFSFSAILHTIYYELNGPKLDVVSPDGNPQWKVYAATASRVAELAVCWFAGFDASDIVAIGILTRVPHLYLLWAYYALPLLALTALAILNIVSTFLPFYLLRQFKSFRLATSPDAVTSDTTITTLTTFLSSLLYTLPYLLLTSTGILPTFLATHFNGLRTLEAAHAATLPGIALLLLPLGWAATSFFFLPAAHPLASSGPTSVTLPFDPVTASLGQTLHRNIFWHLYMPARTQEATKRIVVAYLLTVGYTAFWSWMEVDGVEPLGALGWASVWGLGSLLTGSILGWVGGLNE